MISNPSTKMYIHLLPNKVNDANIIFDPVANEYVLLDFGYGSYFGDDHELESMNELPIVGTFGYFSESLYLMNKYLAGNATNHNVSRHQVKKLAMNGNLYSLQSVILEHLVHNDRDDRDTEIRIEIGQMHDEVEAIFRKGGAGGWSRMHEPLRMIWSLRHQLLRNYIQRHPDERNLVNTVFTRLPQEGDQLVHDSCTFSSDGGFPNEIDPCSCSTQ